MNAVPFDILWVIRGVFVVLFGTTLFFLKRFADSVDKLANNVSQNQIAIAEIRSHLKMGNHGR